MESLLFIRDGILGAPPGVTPNFVDPPTRGPEMVAASIAVTVLALIIVLMRIVTKLYITKGFDTGDYLAVVAMACAIARTVISGMVVYNWHLGRHIWDLEPWNFTSVKNCQFIMDMIYLFGIMCAKLSILLLYAKVFHIRRQFRWLCYAMMGLTVTYCIMFIFIYGFSCNPVKYTWHFDPLHSLDFNICVEITKVTMAIGGFNIFTDVVIMIMPLPLVWRLQLGKVQRAGLMLVFGTGLLICIMAIVRQVIVVKTDKEVDQSWTVVDEIVWLTVELNIGIICVCMPVLAPIWRSMIAKRLGLSYLRSLMSGMTSSRGGGSHGQSKITDTDSAVKMRGTIDVRSDWSAHYSDREGSLHDRPGPIRMNDLHAV